MITIEVSALILEAITLQQQIKELETHLEAIKAAFRDEAEMEIRREQKLTGDTRLAGQSATFMVLFPDGHELAAQNGPKVIVSYPEPGLLKSYFYKAGKPAKLAKDESGRYKPQLLAADPRELCGEKWKNLFEPQYRPAHSFVELAKMALTPAKAGKLIELCTEPPGGPTVRFYSSRSAADVKAVAGEAA